MNVWTVDDPDRMAELASWGVDGIVTNKPDVARAVVDAGPDVSGAAKAYPRAVAEALPVVSIYRPSRPPRAPPTPLWAGPTWAPLWFMVARSSSLGCTMTQPWPAKLICTASPVPRPMRPAILKLRATLVWRLADQHTTALESTKVGASVWRTTGVPWVVMATQPVPRMIVLNRPPDIMPAPLDEVDVDVHRGVVGEHVASVDADGVALEVDEVHVAALVGEEDVGLAGDGHGGDALTGELLLEHLADAARALVVEVGLALVGDHRALPRRDGAVELDLEHLRVLQTRTGRRTRLSVLAKRSLFMVELSRRARVETLTARERRGQDEVEDGGVVAEHQLLGVAEVVAVDLVGERAVADDRERVEVGAVVEKGQLAHRPSPLRQGRHGQPQDLGKASSSSS